MVWLDLALTILRMAPLSRHIASILACLVIFYFGSSHRMVSLMSARMSLADPVFVACGLSDMRVGAIRLFLSFCLFKCHEAVLPYIFSPLRQSLIWTRSWYL